MFLLDVTHTSHTRAQTGIQRVVRALADESARQQAVTPVCYDPYESAWRALNSRESRQLHPAQTHAGTSRGARWPLADRLAGHARRWLGQTAALPEAHGLVCPELFSSKVAAHLPALFARVRGPRVAVFHDAIGLKLPEMTPPGTVTRLPAYLRELLQFDGIAAVSDDSAETLREFWHWLGVSATPVIATIPLGLDPRPAHPAGPTQDIPVGHAPPPDLAPPLRAEGAPQHQRQSILLVDNPTSSSGRPRILCVGTIEGRKNHLSLLAACEALWTEGLSFELHLQGLARPDTAAPALAKIAALQAAGRPLRYDGAVTDRALHAAYAGCDFTVYPSLLEGFGLPVLESLQHGKPCICSATGALGESARGGGCLTVAQPDASALAGAIRALLVDREKLSALTAAARAREFRSWGDYTSDLFAWMQTLPRRA